MVVKTLVKQYVALDLRWFACKQRAATHSNCGFTLIELIVVVAIVGVLATAAIPTLNSYIKTSKNSTCAAEIRTIEKAIISYSIEHNNTPPASLNDIGMGSRLDPWKRTYVYKNLGDVGAVPLEDIAGNRLNYDFDLYSKGQDGGSFEISGDLANDDDIVRAYDGSFAGGRP